MIFIIMGLLPLVSYLLFKKTRWRLIGWIPILSILLYILCISHVIFVKDLIRNEDNSLYILLRNDKEHYLICHGDESGGYHVGVENIYDPELLVRFLELDNNIRISKVNVLCCYPGSHRESSQCTVVSKCNKCIRVDYWPKLGVIYWREVTILD